MAAAARRGASLACAGPSRAKTMHAPLQLHAALRIPSPPAHPQVRRIHASPRHASHENPLGLPRSGERPPPSMPRRSRSGAPAKRKLPNVHRVLAVSSCKGGVGKSTVAANVALSLLNNAPAPSSLALRRRPRVGLLDLDIFGPSVPKIMGLENLGADVTSRGALIPLTNHGLPTMSMSYLLPREQQAGSPIVWRGLMVQKAVQQLLFDVDWRRGAVPGTPSAQAQDPPADHDDADADADSALDVLVIDMPPGTGDVALTLTQLVALDGAVVVSTPQEVALEDTRKGVAMFRKVGVQTTGLVLNMAHYIPPRPLPQEPLPLFGPARPFEDLAAREGLPVLGKIPLEPAVSAGGDAGWPVCLRGEEQGGETRRVFLDIASKVWESLLRDK